MAPFWRGPGRQPLLTVGGNEEIALKSPKIAKKLLFPVSGRLFYEKNEGRPPGKGSNFEKIAQTC